MRDRRRALVSAPRLAVVQGIYYAVTGVWPLVSMRSFQAVTGPKTDRWLVKTVGVLVAVIGTVLALGGRRRRIGEETTTLAMGSAAGLAAIDTVYATTGRISKVYLLDAIVEAVLLVAWLAATGRRRRRSGRWRW
jgi:hypothetical protein